MDFTDSQIDVHPLSSNPTEAWVQLKDSNMAENVVPMNPDTPISPDKVRFVCLSDTHSMTSRMAHPVPEGDVLIHAGDFTISGLNTEVRAFNEFLGMLSHPYKIVIAGNHDLSFDPKADIKKKFKIKNKNGEPLSDTDLLDFGLNLSAPETTSHISNPCEFLTNCTYLQDSSVEVCGLKIYGSPWQPLYNDIGWAFKLIRGADILEKWNMIPSDTDILVTHGPPVGHGDLCHRGDRAGCVELLQTIQKRVKPLVHIFGHVHEGYGITTNGVTMFVNASTCTKRHTPETPTNPPIVFDIPLPVNSYKVRPRPL